MNQLKILQIAASIIVYFLLQAHGADKYTDENRPYEFGFKVDGQQHRHESKDEDGIIMGEFGFITADDVYHVTVYATDKEGRFKILSMKNIKLKQSPAQNSAPPTSARQGHSLALPAPVVATAQVAPAQVIVQGAPATQPKKPISIEPPGKSCSSCSIPTTSTPAPPPALNQEPNKSPNVFPAQRNNFGLGGQSQGELPNYPTSQQKYPQQGTSVSQNYPQEGSRTQADVPTYAQQSEQNYPSAPNAQNPSAPNYPSNAQSPSVSNYPSNVQSPSIPKYSSNSQPGPSAIVQNLNANLQPPVAPQKYSGEQHNLPSDNNGPYAGPQPSGPVGSAPPVDSFGQGSPQQSGPNTPIPSQNPYAKGGAPGRTSKQYNGPDQLLDSYSRPNGQQGPGQVQPRSSKPTLVSAQMQIVDKNTNIHALGPGEQEGLPPGLTEDDVSQLLYTFNYTVGFHGHFEEGYRNGVKKGYYFVTGRNGVKTRIDYVADDTGFHPRVSQEVLDLLSDDVPKPETEKDAKFGLKGYEFKWLYYPTDSKKR